MSNQTQFILKLAISAMMALPQSLLAQGSVVPVSPASATEGVPVAVIPDQGGYVLVGTIPAAEERSTALALAKNNPDSLAVLVRDGSDEVFQGVKQSGFLKRVKVFAATTKRLPAKLKEQVQRVTDFAKREKAGIIMSFIGAGAFAGTMTYLGSSSVEGGLTILGGLTLLYAFYNTKTKFWESVLHGAGERAVEGLQFVGIPMDDEAKQYVTGTASFATAWVVNIAAATFILLSADHYTSFAQAAIFGFLANYNVWDAPILKKLTLDFSRLVYFGLQFSVAPMAEAAMYSGNPAAQWVLGVTTISGLIYAIHHARIDRSLTARARALKDFFTPVKDVEAPKKRCERMLQAHGFEIWGDVQ